MEDIIDDYLEYTKNTEPPRVFHRWCLLTSIGALLGRNTFIHHGHYKVYPNLYSQLIGESGTRKSSAIKLCKRLVSASGYINFAADKTSKEKFLGDLAGGSFLEDSSLEGGGSSRGRGRSKQPDLDITQQNLWGEENEKEPKEVFIVADEFNEFAGSSNYELHTTLGNLWDWDDENAPFFSSFKSGSVKIWQPTVSLLTGNTQEGFSRAFPPDTVGQGFLSRMLLIYGTKSDRRIAFPPVPNISDTSRIVTTLMRIRGKNARGGIELTPEAYSLLSEIYTNWKDLSDIRLTSYSTRRFTQLLKLCLIITCARFLEEITADVVVYANTILSAAEINMPRALGEFGKAKNSDITNRLITFLERSSKPQSITEIWRAVGHGNLGKTAELAELINGLKIADKVQYVEAGPSSGYLAKRVVNRNEKYVNWSLLTPEEREYIS